MWGKWSDCTEDCSGGSQYRVREIIDKRQFGGSPCIGEGNETRSCQNYVCHSKAYNRLIILKNRRMIDTCFSHLNFYMLNIF